MVAEMIGSEAWRPNGTYFGGPNPYGEWNPSVAGTGLAGAGVVGTNGMIGINRMVGAGRVGGYNPYGPMGGYNPYNPMGGFPSIWGNVGAMGMGFTKSTTYDQQMSTKSDIKMCKGEIEDLQFTLEEEWDEDAFLKQFNEFKEKFKRTGTYKIMLNTEMQELIASGMDEQSAKAAAEENCNAKIFDELAEMYETVTGKNFKKAIGEKFSFDKNQMNFIRQLQGKPSLYK